MQMYEETVLWIYVNNFAIYSDSYHISCKRSAAMPPIRFLPLGKKTGRMEVSEVLCRASTDQTFLQMACELDERVTFCFVLRDSFITVHT